MAGVDDPSVIDLIAEEADGNVAPIMVETRPWDGGEEQENELWRKFDGYTGYFKSGQFGEDHPEYAGKPLEFRLECPVEPPESIMGILVAVAQRLEPFGIGITYNVNENLDLE